MQSSYQLSLQNICYGHCHCLLDQLSGDVADFTDRGFQPAASIKAIPSLVKRLSQGRKVGYVCTYTTGDGEWLATFPLGFADGYWRHLSNNGFIVRDRTGEEQTHCKESYCHNKYCENKKAKCVCIRECLVNNFFYSIDSFVYKKNILSKMFL